MSEKLKTENSEEAESERFERLYRKATDPVLRTHLLIVWRISLGEPLGEVARMVGYSQKWVREIKRRYEAEGVEGLGDRRHRNPGARERALLDEEGQAELRAALLEGSPPGGGMWSGPKVARWIQERTGAEKLEDLMRLTKPRRELARKQYGSAEDRSRDEKRLTLQKSSSASATMMPPGPRM